MPVNCESRVNETITVGGKAIACKCYEMESDADGMKTTTRACSSAAVPGGAVKVVDGPPVECLRERQNG